MIFLKNYFINTTGDIDCLSVIHEVIRTVRESNLQEGLVTVVVPAPGGGVTIIEPLTDLTAQLKEALAVFPGLGAETKNRRKEEIAVGPRVVAAMLGKSLSVPLTGGKLTLGPREEIILIDLEKSGKRREFFVQVMGDAPPAAAQGPKVAAQKRRQG